MHSDNFLTISQVMRMLPVQEPDFENPCPKWTWSTAGKGVKTMYPWKILSGSYPYPFSDTEVEWAKNLPGVAKQLYSF